MSQQINLYQPFFLEKKIPFSFNRIVSVLAVVLFLVLTTGAVSLWRLSSLKYELAQLQERRAAAVQRISDYQLRYPPRSADPALIRKVERMMSDRQARFALLGLLTGSRPGNSRGFSEYLAGLARQDLPSVWLRRIQLSAGGDQLLLEGSTTRAADVPLYLQRLTGQPVYAGREFEHLQLNRSENGSQFIDFLLQTTQEEKP
jgi:Tfp pilus assembly protein PilN